MISLSKYHQNPCGALSIPYWKARRVFLPENMPACLSDRLLRSGAYCGALWLPAKGKASGLYAGCGIANYDGETGVVSLEWIQALVCEPLRREQLYRARRAARADTALSAIFRISQYTP